LKPRSSDVTDSKLKACLQFPTLLHCGISSPLSKSNYGLSYFAKLLFRWLESADAKGFLSDFPDILTKLRMSGFFLAEAIEQRLLRRHRARRGLG